MSTAPQPAPRPTANPAAGTPAKPPIGDQAIKRPVAPLVPSDEADRAKLRRSVYALLITLSCGAMMGRILAINSVDSIRSEARIRDDLVQQRKQEMQAAGQLAGKSDSEIKQMEAKIADETRLQWQRQRPFLSANDRSRWLTMRALVERGTYAVEQYVTDPKTYPNWDSIDLVMHQDAEGKPHLYSSKPPLLATLYAGPYWAIYKLTAAIRGAPATLSTNPYEIDRGMLVLVNLIPLVIYFVMLAAILEQFGRTDWGRIFVMAAATFGTFLTTFAVVLNNHLPAAVCAVITLYAAMQIWYGDDRLRYFVIAGVFGALTAAFELPALSMFALLTVMLLWKAPRPALVAFVPPALVVIAAFFATNWLEFRSFIPAYAHRKYEPSLSIAETVGTPSVPEKSNLYEGTLTLDSGVIVALRGNPDNWYDYEYTRTDGRLIESYWRPNHPQGVDAGEPSIGKYAFHLLIGHHGILSLTPVWLLVIPGIGLLLWSSHYRMRDLAILIALVSAACVTFFLFRPALDRNYGGTTSGFRWIFWLSPLWLLAVMPVADKLSTWHPGRIFGCLLLALSVLSATYPVWNPWTHPWLFNLWNYLGW